MTVRDPTLVDATGYVTLQLSLHLFLSGLTDNLARRAQTCTSAGATGRRVQSVPSRQRTWKASLPSKRWCSWSCCTSPRSPSLCSNYTKWRMCTRCGKETTAKLSKICFSVITKCSFIIFFYTVYALLFELFFSWYKSIWYCGLIALKSVSILFHKFAHC